jgi:hypothetical protein
VGARADRIASGQDAGSARRTLRLHVHVGEAQPLARELVDARRRRAARCAPAVDPQLAVAEIVDEDEQDVGLRPRRRLLSLCDLHRRARPKCGRRDERGAAKQDAATIKGTIVRSPRRPRTLRSLVPDGHGGSPFGVDGPSYEVASVLPNTCPAAGLGLDLLKVRQRPGTVEVGLGRLVEPEIRKPVLTGDRRNPILLEAGRRLRATIDVHRTVCILA